MTQLHRRLLGTILIELEDGTEQRVDVIGIGEEVTFGYPYYHVVHPSNTGGPVGWVREMQVILADSPVSHEGKRRIIRILRPGE